MHYGLYNIMCTFDIKQKNSKKKNTKKISFSFLEFLLFKNVTLSIVERYPKNHKFTLSLSFRFLWSVLFIRLL